MAIDPIEDEPSDAELEIACDGLSRPAHTHPQDGIRAMREAIGRLKAERAGILAHLEGEPSPLVRDLLDDNARDQRVARERLREYQLLLRAGN